MRCRCAPRGMWYADRWLSYVVACFNWKGLRLTGEPVLLARVFLPFHASAGTGNVTLRATLLGPLHIEGKSVVVNRSGL